MCFSRFNESLFMLSHSLILCKSLLTFTHTSLMSYPELQIFVSSANNVSFDAEDILHISFI